mgnify:CR=1 FL=1
MKYASLIVLLLLSGCAAINEKIEAYQKQSRPIEARQAYAPPSSEGSVHYHVEKLARQLFDTTNAFDVSRPMVVGTFLPADNLSGESNQTLMPYGIQIQESFATFATQAGLNIVEFKTLPRVKVTKMADIMMSRAVDELDPRINADYMITGTYMQQQSSLVVNVRLIRVFDKTIIAAATDYLPIDSMWSHSKVQMKNNQIYRGEY